MGYQEDTEGLYVNILTNEARGGTAQGDIISGFEGIIGGSGNDVLIGNNGDNDLFGNEGDDVIFGGLGNDIIIEESGYNTLYGEDGDDFIYGGVNDDFIIGGDDNDTIYGKYGNDRISGGEGNDIFVFDTELNEDGNVDKISDFIHSDDVFYIDNDIFESFSSVIFGSIESENFVSGKSAIDENDYIIYDTDTGNIWYDADGSGAESSAVLFATLCNKPADIDYTNFIVI
ncbi:Ca2+-binding protein, RTX toxin (fragment) [Sulfurovum sp. enrichment culture clone C5]|uniref:Ca2+-binding protein, RTX toxin n=1 Tax=Sulfurovum sp. enrichment culture clone C5 TaxID=497650 RepID=A0A0S4XPD7_9BACT